MGIAQVILVLLAVVFTAMAATDVPTRRVQWGWLGVCLALLAWLITIVTTGHVVIR